MEITEIISEFEELFKVLDTFDKENFYDHRRGSWMFYPNKGNVRVAANTRRRIADLWSINRNILKAWTDEYFAVNQEEIFNKYYLDAALKIIEDNLNPFWRFKEADADFLEFCPNLDQWRQAEQLVHTARARMDMSNCDPAIKEKHRGIECNQGLMCLLCDDIESEWHGVVRAELRRSDNIFLNVGRQCQILAPSNWQGPPRHQSPVPTIPSLDGMTPQKAMNTLIGHNYCISKTFKYYGHIKKEYDIFLRLWTDIDFIDEHLGSFVSAANEIEGAL
jgi:hypothetical protein